MVNSGLSVLTGYRAFRRHHVYTEFKIVLGNHRYNSPEGCSIRLCAVLVLLFMLFFVGQDIPLQVNDMEAVRYLRSLDCLKRTFK